MTNEEKKRLSAVLRATEYLFLENIALKLVLEHRQAANWQKLLDHVLSDREILGGVRLKFSDLYRELEAAKDPSSVLNVFLGGLPASKNHIRPDQTHLKRAWRSKRLAGISETFKPHL